MFEVYGRCARERRPITAAARASLVWAAASSSGSPSRVHADAPDDVAPSAYNEDDPPGGLPASPLARRPAASGFRWAGKPSSRNAERVA